MVLLILHRSRCRHWFASDGLLSIPAPSAFRIRQHDKTSTPFAHDYRAREDSIPKEKTRTPDSNARTLRVLAYIRRPHGVAGRRSRVTEAMHGHIDGNERLECTRLSNEGREAPARQQALDSSLQCACRVQRGPGNQSRASRPSPAATRLPHRGTSAPYGRARFWISPIARTVLSHAHSLRRGRSPAWRDRAENVRGISLCGLRSRERPLLGKADMGSGPR
jgi:hypothetical protein